MDRLSVIAAVASFVILMEYELLANIPLPEFLTLAIFWCIAFPGSIAGKIVVLEKGMNFRHMVPLVIAVSMGLLVFSSINLVFGLFQAGSIYWASRIVSAAVGVIEELFFGVFGLGVLIKAGLPPPPAIVLVSAAHTCYHIPHWGANPLVLGVFFLCFCGVRFVYVYWFQHTSTLLLSHGLWNWLVS